MIPRHSPRWLWVLLAALLLRGVLAPGVMPQVSAAGFAVVLCTADGARTVWLNPDGDAPPHAAQDCAYALALGMAGAAGAEVPLRWAGASTLRVSWRPAARSSAPGKAHRARAPPAYA